MIYMSSRLHYLLYSVCGCVWNFISMGVICAAVFRVSLPIGRWAGQGGVEQGESALREGQSHMTMFVQGRRGGCMY